MSPETYTHTRIRREYLDKLQALAVRDKRSAVKQLEVLIDAAIAQWEGKNRLAQLDQQEGQ